MPPFLFWQKRNKRHKGNAAHFPVLFLHIQTGELWYNGSKMGETATEVSVMVQRHFGEWVLEVDVDATRAYYESFKVDEKSQCWRNYAKHCENLLPEEKDFFDSLSIIPPHCHVTTIGLDKDRSYPTFGAYFVIGRFISKPEEILWTVEKLEAHGFEDDRPDNRLNIGRYTFDFQDPDSPFSSIPDDMPEGAVCFEFSAESIPWLLDEKCEEKMYYPPRWWQFVKKAKERKREKELYKKDLLSLTQTLNDMFSSCTIKATELMGKETVDYMQQWFKNIVPADKQEEAKDHCFPTRDFGAFLWHAFSYEYAPCLTESDAEAAFDAADKSACVLLMNNEKIGYVLENAECLTASIVNEFNDIIITSKDFSWTYTHTHEEYCGPYFASIK
jgi:hypothetical protein